MKQKKLFLSTFNVILTGVFLLTLWVSQAIAGNATVCSSGCDFTTIQNAHDNASVVNGDTITITDSGSYAGVNITKEVTIKAEAGQTPVIDTAIKWNVAIFVDASNVTIEGLKLNCPTCGGGVAVGYVDANVSATRFINNELLSPATGVLDSNSINVVRAIRNYWGDGTGPSGGKTDANDQSILANGAGAKIAGTGNVRFSPWYKEGTLDNLCTADNDNDGFCTNENDCADDNETINPDADEICDSTDRDCDGDSSSQDGVALTQSCYTGPDGTKGVGECAEGTQTCVGGTYQGQACVGDITPAAELCDGKDNDCNNETDNNGGCHTVDENNNTILNVDVNTENTLTTYNNIQTAIDSLDGVSGSIIIMVKDGNYDGFKVDKPGVIVQPDNEACPVINGNAVQYDNGTGPIEYAAIYITADNATILGFEINIDNASAVVVDNATGAGIYYNSLYSGSGNAAAVYGVKVIGNNKVNATDNFWGDSSGPSGGAEDACKCDEGGGGSCDPGTTVNVECTSYPGGVTTTTTETLADTDCDGVAEPSCPVDSDCLSGGCNDNCPDLNNPEQNEDDCAGCTVPVECTSYPGGVTTTTTETLADADCDGVAEPSCPGDSDCLSGGCNDNCPDLNNPEQNENDCEACDPNTTVNVVCTSNSGPSTSTIYSLADADCDGVAEPSCPVDFDCLSGDCNDNCPDLNNPEQNVDDCVACDPNTTINVECTSDSAPNSPTIYLLADADCDGVAEPSCPDDFDCLSGDCNDNCPDKYNTDQADIDDNGIGDACESQSESCEYTADGLGAKVSPNVCFVGAREEHICAPVEPIHIPPGEEVESDVVDGLTLGAEGAGVDVFVVDHGRTNPENDSAFEVGAKYFDIKVPVVSDNLTSITIKLCGVGDDTVLRWFDDTQGAWLDCTPQSNEGGCIELTVNNETSIPLLGQLGDTVFGFGSNAIESTTTPTDGGGSGQGGSASIPLLSVTGFVNMGTVDDMKSFVVTNRTGVGTLSWSIGEVTYNEVDGWITGIDPKTGNTTSASTVTINVSREGLTSGTYTAEIPIASNGGSDRVTVSMEVPEIPPPALTVSPVSLEFEPGDTEGTLTISNEGDGSLSWEVVSIDYESGNGWITVNPEEGDLESNESDTVTVSVSAEGLADDIYSATINIESAGGTSVSVAVTMVVMDIPDDNPIIDIDPSFHFLLTRSKSESDGTISNKGTGVMEWNIGEIEYLRGDGWITVEPASGSLGEGQEETVRIKIDRTGLRMGFHIARVPIVAGDNKEYMIVIMRAPLFNSLGR